MTTLEPPTPRRRFRPRLSLRALMLLVLVAGAGLGWWAAERARARRQDAIIATLQSAGLTLSLERSKVRRVLSASTLASNFSKRSPLTADQDRALAECTELLHLMLTSVVVTDETVTTIGRLSKLNGFSCVGPEVSDAGLAPLARLGDLRMLNLVVAPGLSDAGLAHVGRVTALEQFSISGSNIKGSGLIHLTGLKRLRSLTIPNNPLDDAGLAAIGRLGQLSHLDIQDGKYSDVGLAHLEPLTGLQGLAFGSPRCTPAALDHLARMGSLETLTVAGPTITDAWLDRVATRQPPSLRAVSLNGRPDHTEAAIARLHKARPRIRLTINGQPK